jgi:hypothetical protein
MKNHKDITSVEFTYGGFFQGHNRLSVISGFHDGSATWSMSNSGSYDGISKFGNISKPQWDEFRKSLVEKAKVLSWKESYTDSFILDGFQWDLSVNFSDGTTLEISGSNDYPKEWAELNSIMAELTGLSDEFDTKGDETDPLGDDEDETVDIDLEEFYDKED